MMWNFSFRHVLNVTFTSGRNRKFNIQRMLMHIDTQFNVSMSVPVVVEAD